MKMLHSSLGAKLCLLFACSFRGAGSLKGGPSAMLGVWLWCAAERRFVAVKAVVSNGSKQSGGWQLWCNLLQSLPHCFTAAGESWARCVVNLVTAQPLGGSATHFINGTIFLHRPIGLMHSFAARIGPNTVEHGGDLAVTLRALVLSRQALPSTIHLPQLLARCMEETIEDSATKRFHSRVLAVAKCRQNVDRKKCI